MNATAHHNRPETAAHAPPPVMAAALARLDATLSTTASAAEKRMILEGAFARFEAAYRRLHEDAEICTPVLLVGVCAADYMLMLCEISRRLSALGETVQ